MKHAFELLVTYFVVVFVLLVGVASTAEPGTSLAPSASLLQLLASVGFIESPELNTGLNTFYLLLAVFPAERFEHAWERLGLGVLEIGEGAEHVRGADGARIVLAGK